MPEEAVIRDIAPADAEACVRIALAAWGPIFDSSREMLGDQLFQLLRPNWRQTKAAEIRNACTGAGGAMTVVATVGGNVVGFVTFHCDQKRRVGRLGNNAVDPDFQGRGIAPRLYAHVLDRMRALGMKVAAVQTGCDPSHAPARRAYEKAGFTARVTWVDYYREL
jgi:GNAT superfamily N-acetyltransferase